MESQSIPDRMRAVLVPRGTAQVVYLQLNNKMFHAEFVNACIGELEKLPFKASIGEPPSNLEKLAYLVLCDSAYIEQPVD